MNNAAYDMNNPAAMQNQTTHPLQDDDFIAPVPRITIHAYCETQGVSSSLEVISKDRRMLRTHFDIHMGGIAAATSTYQSSSTPDLLILESTTRADELIVNLMALAEVCDPDTKVVIIGHINDVVLYRELIAKGISEYTVYPIVPLQFIELIGDLYNDPEAGPLGRIIAFLGAKGGCGSSTLAHNTAWTIGKNYQKDVALADLDLPFGTAALDFNQDPPQGIADAVYGSDELDDVLLDRLLSKCSDHLSLFAAPSVLDQPFDLDSNAYERVLDVARANVPVIVIDLPHQWCAWVLDVLSVADEIVIVAEPDLANLRNAKNLVEHITQNRPNDKKPHLVLNKCGVPQRPEISTAEFSSALSLIPSAVIPFDPNLFGTASNNGQMIEQVAAGTKTNIDFSGLAAILTGKNQYQQAEEAKQSKSLFAPLLDKLTKKKE